MSDSLSIPSLLKQIQPTAVDAEIYSRCLEAERSSRRRDFDSALAQAQAAADVATQSGAAVDIGIAFLYLAIIRHLRPRKREQDQARDDANTALEWLKGNAHHAVIAHLIRARILLDDGQPRPAMTHYRRANELLTKLIVEWHRRDRPDQERYYSNLQQAIHNAMKQLQLTPTTTGRLPRDTSADASSSPAPIPLPLPTKLVWSKKPVELRFRLPTLDSPESLAPDTVNEVWIDGRRYRVEPIEPASPLGRSMRLIPGQKYTVFEIEDEQAVGDAPKRYVLARAQGQASEATHYIVLTDATTTRAWFDRVEAADLSGHVHIIGLERDLDVTTKGDLSIHGIAEALLSPLPADEAEPSTTTPSCVTDVDEDLLTCIDVFNLVCNVPPDVARDLAMIHATFHHYLKNKLRLEIIPITPGETIFDPNLGHHAIGIDQDPTLRDSVIVRVKRDGYLRDGKPVRDAYVVVNKVSA